MDAATTLLSVRRRWARLPVPADGVALRVALLATYTIDPLVPHLGVGLHEAGLPIRPTVGPYHQIVQSCLDDAAGIAGAQPDVLVVAPRLEDMPTPTWHTDLHGYVDAALSAADRWRSCLVFVLPAVPEDRPHGAGDAGSPDSTFGAATAVREALRRRLSGRPNVYLADAEEAVRAVGARRAHRPALFRYARVPYADEVFAEMAGQIVALLRMRHLGAPRAVAVDLDGFDSQAVAMLRDPVLRLGSAGVRLAACGRGPAAQLWHRLATHLPELALDCHCLVADDRPLATQLDAVARELGLPASRLVLLTTDADRVTWAGPTCLLGDPEPATFVGDMQAAGLFDALPVGLTGQEPSPDLAPPPRPALSLDNFVAQLDVRVTFREAVAHDAEVAEMLARAHDFTLAGPVRPPGPCRQTFAAHVVDRLGDYGTAGAASLDCHSATAVVDLFAISCPALGRGVEDAMLGELVARADGCGCADMLVVCRETGRNRIAVDFLRSAAERVWSGPSGRDIRVRVQPVPP